MIKQENQVCSDCPERQPRWASLIVPPPGSPPGSLAMGALCCLECSGSHRRLGVHISFVRSITLDSCKFKVQQTSRNCLVNKLLVILKCQFLFLVVIYILLELIIIHHCNRFFLNYRERKGSSSNGEWRKWEGERNFRG